MNSSEKRKALNTAAGVCAVVGTSIAAAGYPVVGLAFASLSTFLVGWANMTKPGDLKVPKGATVTHEGDTVSITPGPDDEPPSPNYGGPA